MHVLHHVSSVVDRSDPAAGVEVHMGEETMLSVSAAHADGARIAFGDFHVHIAHRRIEGSRAGVSRLATGVRPRAGEEYQIAFLILILISGGIGLEYEHRPRPAIADDANARPDV